MEICDAKQYLDSGEVRERGRERSLSFEASSCNGGFTENFGLSWQSTQLEVRLAPWVVRLWAGDKGWSQERGNKNHASLVVICSSSEWVSPVSGVRAVRDVSKSNFVTNNCYITVKSYRTVAVTTTDNHLVTPARTAPPVAVPKTCSARENIWCTVLSYVGPPLQRIDRRTVLLYYHSVKRPDNSTKNWSSNAHNHY